MQDSVSYQNNQLIKGRRKAGFERTSLRGALTALNSVKAMKAGFTPMKPKLSNRPGALRMKVNSRNWVMRLNWMMPRFFRVCFSFQ